MSKQKRKHKQQLAHARAGSGVPPRRRRSRNATALWLGLGLVALATVAILIRAYQDPRNTPRPTTATAEPSTPSSTPPARRPTTPEPPEPPAPPGAAPTDGPAEVTASHVLVMHRDSQRRPDSVTRSREEARVRAEDVLRRARAGEDFAQLARTYSDEPGAATSGGSLGSFGRRAMHPAFERAAFALQPGHVSDIVETPFGFHVIRRTE